jgi:hypothetical protein
MSWSFRALLGEALVNLRVNATRTLFLFAAVAVVCGSLALLELRQSSDLLDFQAGLVRSGGYVAVASVQGGISAAKCAALEGTPGVVAAGGVRSHGQATFATAPGVLFQSASITAGMVRTWDPAASREATSPATPALVLGRAASDDLGVRSGLAVVPEGESPVTVHVIDPSVRNPQASRWVLDIVPASGVVDECWVEFTPGAYVAGLAGLPARFSDASTEAVARPYLRQGDFARNPQQELSGRPQRYGWVVAAALLAGIALLAAWFRRTEIGLYIALGTSRSAIAVMFATEIWVVAAVSWGVSMLWVLAIAELLGYNITFGAMGLALLTSSSCALAVCAVAPPLCALVARGSIAGLLKDR